MITIILVATATMFLGVFAGMYIKSSDVKRIDEQRKELQSKNENLTEKIQQLTNELSVEKTKLQIFEKIQELVKKDFTLIANEVIKSEQKGLREQNQEAVEEKLKPLKENFEKFRDKIEEFNKQGAENTAKIQTQIKTLIDESNSIKTTADDLSKAIKENSQKRGILGEMILENLLSQAGLVNKNDDEEKGNYITQHVFKDFANPTQLPRPDAVVFFPDQKHIIIDSKCPLNNFVEYVNCQEEAEKENNLKAFYNSVLAMIDELSGKYNTLEGLNTPEFKLMFIPLESCASYLYGNRELLDKAAKQNIIIVCPSTLLATLKIINKTWQQKAQAENLSKILKTATNTYEKLKLFLKNTEEIRTKFQSLDKSFDKLFSSATGRGGFVKQIENLRELGITINGKVDEKYLTDELQENFVVED